MSESSSWSFLSVLSHRNALSPPPPERAPSASPKTHPLSSPRMCLLSSLGAQRIRRQLGVKEPGGLTSLLRTRQRASLPQQLLGPLLSRRQPLL